MLNGVSILINNCNLRQTVEARAVIGQLEKQIGAEDEAQFRVQSNFRSRIRDNYGRGCTAKLRHATSSQCHLVNPLPYEYHRPRGIAVHLGRQKNE